MSRCAILLCGLSLISSSAVRADDPAVEKKLALAQEEIDRLKAQVAEVTAQRDAVRKELDRFRQLAVVSDIEHRQMQKKLEHLLQQNEAQVDQLEHLRTLTKRMFDLDKGFPLGPLPLRDPPNPIRGTVVAYIEGGLTTISIGSDAGVSQGMRLSIYRLDPAERKPGDLEFAQAQATFHEPLPPGIIAIGHDPGGNLLLLATIGQDAGRVYFWDKRGFYVREDGHNTFPVADSFTAFLESLRDLEEDE